jgi:putative two-component system response regulator
VIAGRILIVDDEPANILLLEHLLRQHAYTDLTSTGDPRQVQSLVARLHPDLILLDLHMPHVDGWQLLQLLREQLPAETYLPILVLTADLTAQAKQRALALGAADFLVKPFDPAEVELRVRNLLTTRALHVRLQQQNQRLDERVRARTRELELAHAELRRYTTELEAAQQEILARLARTAEYRDDATGQHTRRVGEMAALVAVALELPAAQVDCIRQAAPLHDLGKIGVRDAILLKPGPLTPPEFEEVKQHTTIGARLLASGTFSLLQMAEEIARTHHERWDGTGYPAGLRGADIPLAGRIVAVVDVFDALVHVRPYKRAWSVTEAVAELERQAGRQFDPRVVSCFIPCPAAGARRTGGRHAPRAARETTDGGVAAWDHGRGAQQHY